MRYEVLDEPHMMAMRPRWCHKSKTEITIDVIDDRLDSQATMLDSMGRMDGSESERE